MVKREAKVKARYGPKSNTKPTTCSQRKKEDKPDFVKEIKKTGVIVTSYEETEYE